MSKRINNIRLNQYFHLCEFEDPTTRTVMVTAALVDGIYMLRLMIKKQIIITSGYRTLKHNIEVGGSAKSYHMAGAAVDIFTAFVDMEKIKRFCKIIGFTEVIYYPETGHWHLAIDK